MLANCWTLSLFDRAVAGHMRGDDHLALASAEMLATVWPVVQAEAASRGFARPSPEKIQQGAPYFLLDSRQATELLAEQQRRAKDRRQGVAPPVLSGDHADQVTFALALAKELSRCPEKARRIDLLMRKLGEESLGSCVESPVGDPCSFQGGNTVVAFLANEGEDSVEPLLTCLERDTRLTRFQSREERYPLPVYLFAEMALDAVLKMPFREPELGNREPQPDESKRRQGQTTKIRGYWTRYKGVPMAERWYCILADDHAEPQSWLVAARAIVQPTSVSVSLRTVALGWDNIPRRANDKQKVHGDVLRNKTKPSVADLMAKRIGAFINAPYYESLARKARFEELGKKLETLEKQLDKLGEQQDKLSEQRYAEVEKRKGELQAECDKLMEHLDEPCASPSACDMALYLAQWDPTVALPHLRRLTAMWRGIRGNPNPGPVGYGDQMVAMVLARAAAGDLTALDEYATWVRVAHPQALWYKYMKRTFEPLCRYPNHPAIVKTTEWLFNDKASPWYPILVRDEWQKELSLNALSSPLVAIPAFRKRVLQLLEDRQQVGHVKVTSNEKIVLGVDSDRETSTVPNDPLCPPPGTKSPFRMCDACAYGLSRLEGTPRCELFWPEKNRDRAVAASAAFLRQYGHRLRLDEKIVDGDGLPLRPGYWDHEQAPLHLIFPLLSRPATPDDVRRGEAIFSLAGNRNVRVPTRPTLPRNARWTTLKDYPFLWEKTICYEQDGIVWQAEEVEVGGRWQRYYGFVGRYGLAKVPAEEIELSTPFRGEEDWIALDDRLLVGLEAAPNAGRRISVRKSEDSDCFPPMLFYQVGQPLVFKVGACNRSGADRPLPLLAESAGGKMPVDSIRVSLQLRYCPETPAIGYVPAGVGPEPICSLVGMSWTQVPRKTHEQLTANPLGRKLGPTEYVDCLQLDLNRLFDVSRPGTYRLSLKLATGKNGTWQENEVVFAVTEKSEAAALPSPGCCEPTH